MNDIIIIREFIHGDVVVAADYKSAIHYLIKERWIGEYTEVYDDNNSRLIPISEAFGKDWRTVLLNANKDWFNDKFVDQFGLRQVEIYKHE